VIRCQSHFEEALRVKYQAGSSCHLFAAEIT
jgi:hypothetical protein